MSHYQKTDAVTYLRTLAMSRIVLDNVPNLQSSWVTMGHKVGQVALRFGANDYGSLMMEENVVSAAGTTYRTTLQEIDRLIRDAGYRPMRRRQDYSVIEEPVARVTRVGIGYDSHRFVAGRPLILGGVTIPHPQGLAGHSDADAVAHALTDAILGAAGAGNIGQLFPDTDPQWKDADSMELLRTAHELVRGRGLHAGAGRLLGDHRAAQAGAAPRRHGRRARLPARRGVRARSA